jgi:hypothetical protein
VRSGTKIAGGFAALYLLIGGITLGPLFAVGGMSDATFSVALVTAVALIPVTAILVTLIGRVQLWTDRAAPAARPPAAAPDGPVYSGPVDAGRQGFEFAFAAWNGIDSRQAVERLSARLTALGIDHDYRRVIAVHDGATRWEVAPVAGALRITGWVEAPSADERMMVMAAIEEFLIEELGIRLEKLAA